MNNEIKGKPVVHIADNEPVLLDNNIEQQSSVDEVETFDDDTESDSELVEHP